MKHLVRSWTLAVGASTIVSTLLPGQQTAPDVGAARFATQVSLGTLALPAGFMTAGLVARSIANSLGASESAARRAAYVSGAAGALAATAGVVSALGSAGPVRGSFPVAVGGGAGGVLLSYALVTLNRRTSPGSTHRCGAVCKATVVAIALLPATGATLAFNATRDAR